MRILAGMFVGVRTQVLKLFPQIRSFSSSLTYSKHGSPASVLRVNHRDMCDPGSNEVKVSMLAAPINPSDLNMIEGTYGVLPSLPAVAGNEGVGVITAVGSAVKNIGLGDRVIPVRPGMGTWSSEAVWSASDVLKVPNHLPNQSAASLFVNPCSAYRLLRDFVSLSPGDVIIQNGANGGVGQLVVQMASQMGLKTINVVRDRPQEQLDLIRDHLIGLGGNLVITEKELSGEGRTILKRLGSHTDGVALALNCVAGKPSADAAKLLKKGGTMVIYGGMSRRPVMVGAGQFIFDDLHVSGFWLTRWMEKHIGTPQADEMFRDIVSMASKGEISAPSEQASTFRVNELKVALEHSGKAFLDLTTPFELPT